MIGAVGLSPTAFDELDWSQVESISAAYHSKEDKVFRTGWEQTRQIMLVTIRPHLKKGVKLKLTDVLEFPWEKTATEEILSPEQAVETAKDLNKFWERLDQK